MLKTGHILESLHIDYEGVEMATIIHCSICGKAVAKRNQSFEKRMSLLREHRKKKHTKEWKKSVKKSLVTRKKRR